MPCGGCASNGAQAAFGSGEATAACAACRNAATSFSKLETCWPKLKTRSSNSSILETRSSNSSIRFSIGSESIRRPEDQSSSPQPSPPVQLVEPASIEPSASHWELQRQIQSPRRQRLAWGLACQSFIAGSLELACQDCRGGARANKVTDDWVGGRQRLVW